MRVLSIATDLNHYQAIVTAQNAASQALSTDGTSLKPYWFPPIVLIDPFHTLRIDPFHTLRGDFLSPDMSSIIVTQRARTALEPILAAAGEILPLPCGKETFWFINVTNVLDCLDVERSVTYPYVKKYVFHKDVLQRSKSQLFKIPQTYRSEVLLVEGLGRKEDEFLSIVYREALSGLQVQQLWEE